MMKVTFWGVRGSIPTPEKKNSFFGGNTSCVELQVGEDTLIFDAGTGLRGLGQCLRKKDSGQKIYLFLSHYHLDHLSGLPFFLPIYDSKNTLFLFGPAHGGESPRKALLRLFDKKSFPLPLSKIPAKFICRSIKSKDFKVGHVEIKSMIINHPGSTLGYVVSNGKHRVGYFCDHEPITSFKHLSCNKENYEKQLLETLSGLDLLIHDAHFLNQEYPHYKGWGHSPWSYPLELAKKAKIKHLIFFHHSPHRTDGELKNALREHKVKNLPFKIDFAREGQTCKFI